MNKMEFRAWNGKRMLHNVGVHPHIIAFHGAEDDQYTESTEGAFTVSQMMDTYKIMQYIGALDKNKRKIFSGDIVRWKGIDFSYVCKVIYDEKEFLGFVLEGIDEKIKERGNVPIGKYGAKLKDLNVIGNVYEPFKINYENE